MSAEQAPFVLITGGSGGIGLELAKLFAKDRFAIGLAARSADKMRALAEELKGMGSPRVDVYPVDLAKDGAAADLFQQVQADHPRIDALVNNAGFGHGGRFVETDWQLYRQMTQLNMVTLTHLTHLVLPGMIQAGKGRVMNVASTAAFQAGPLMGVYFATKAFVLHVSEAIAEELQGTGVSVTALCPGATHTGFQDRADLGGSGLFKGPNVMRADTVARKGYAAMNRGKRIVITGWVNRILVFLPRLVPRYFSNKVVKAVVG